MAGTWITGPLPTRPSTVPASWAEEIARMNARHRAAGPDPAWLQDDESDKGEPPEGADLDAIYDDLAAMALHVGQSDPYLARGLARAMDRLARAIP